MHKCQEPPNEPQESNHSCKKGPKRQDTAQDKHYHPPKLTRVPCASQINACIWRKMIEKQPADSGTFGLEIQGHWPQKGETNNFSFLLLFLSTEIILVILDRYTSQQMVGNSYYSAEMVHYFTVCNLHLTVCFLGRGCSKESFNTLSLPECFTNKCRTVRNIRWE